MNPGDDAGITTAPRGTSRTLIAVIGILGLALVIRGVLAVSPSFTLDADKAVVYLMALRQSEGATSWIFWGQSYGGSLIAMVSGAVMVVGGNSVLIVVAVTAGATLGCAVILWDLARPHGRLLAVATVVFFLFPGAYLLRQSIDDGGFYSTSVIFALGALWLAIRAPGFHAREFLLGFAIGLAFWCSPMGLALALPAGVVEIRRSGRRVVIALGLGALIGASPWVVGTILRILDGSTHSGMANPFVDIPDRIVGLFVELIPAAFPGGVGPASWVIGVLVVGLLVALGAEARRDRWGLAACLLVGVLVLFALLMASGLPLGDDARRYVTFLLPALAYSLARTLQRFGPKLAAPILISGAALAMIGTTGAVVTTMNVTTVDVHQIVPPDSTTWPTVDDRFGADAALVAAELEDRGLVAVYATYWLSYRLSAASQERVIASDFTLMRYPPYLAAAARANPGVIVVFDGTAEFDSLRSTDARTQFSPVPGITAFVFDRALTPDEVARLTGTTGGS